MCCKLIAVHHSIVLWFDFKVQIVDPKFKSRHKFKFRPGSGVESRSWITIQFSWMSHPDCSHVETRNKFNWVEVQITCKNEFKLKRRLKQKSLPSPSQSQIRDQPMFSLSFSFFSIQYRVQIWSNRKSSRLNNIPDCSHILIRYHLRSCQVKVCTQKGRCYDTLHFPLQRSYIGDLKHCLAQYMPISHISHMQHVALRKPNLQNTSCCG